MTDASIDIKLAPALKAELDTEEIRHWMETG